MSFLDVRFGRSDQDAKLTVPNQVLLIAYFLATLPIDIATVVLTTELNYMVGLPIRVRWRKTSGQNHCVNFTSML